MRRFEDLLRSLGLSPQDVVPADGKGYWRVKGGCKGGEQCRHAFRGELGPCDGKVGLTLSYGEHGVRDQRGRWVRPYRVWEEARKTTKP